MKEETRRAIAHAASARINRQSLSSLYSHSHGRHTPMSGSGNSAYDHDSGPHGVDEAIAVGAVDLDLRMSSRHLRKHRGEVGRAEG